MFSNREERQELLHSSLVYREKYSKVVRKILKGVGAGICIGLMVGSWAIMAEKLQDLGQTFNQPFFQTCFIHSFYSLMYVVWKFSTIIPDKYFCNKAGNDERVPTSFRKFFVASGFLALVSYVSAVLWYFSLDLTSVSANTAIYQSASVVVFILSVPLLKERVTVVKIFCVLLTIVGVCLISLFSLKDRDFNITNSTELPRTENLKESHVSLTRNTPLGFVYVIASMILYAAYETMYKKFGTISNDPAPIWNGFRIIGYIGVHTMVTYWPILIVVHYTGLEKFRFPTLEEFRLLVGMICLDIVFNVALFICIVLSSPLLASVGTVLTLPTTVLLDWILKGHIMTWQAFIGVGGIAIGFLLLVFSEYWAMRREMNNTSRSEELTQSMSESSGQNFSGKNIRTIITHHLI